jgi:hypothetical protein
MIDVQDESELLETNPNMSDEDDVDEANAMQATLDYKTEKVPTRQTIFFIKYLMELA